MAGIVANAVLVQVVGGRGTGTGAGLPFAARWGGRGRERQ